MVTLIVLVGNAKHGIGCILIKTNYRKGVRQKFQGYTGAKQMKKVENPWNKPKLWMTPVENI